MLKGFKEFMMRGNVVDLAVAVVIGGAFTAIVTAIVENFINPLIAALGGGDSPKGLTTELVGGNEAAVINWGNILGAVINFVMIAAVVYFVIVLPVKKIQERRRRGEDPAPVEPTDVQLLAEIRDLLAAQNRRP